MSPRPCAHHGNIEAASSQTVTGRPIPSVSETMHSLFRSLSRVNVVAVVADLSYMTHLHRCHVFPAVAPYGVDVASYDVVHGLISRPVLPSYEWYVAVSLVHARSRWTKRSHRTRTMRTMIHSMRTSSDRRCSRYLWRRRVMMLRLTEAHDTDVRMWPFQCEYVAQRRRRNMHASTGIQNW